MHCTRLLLFSLLFTLSAAAQQYDVLIRHGRLVDGSGNPWIHADVGIVGDRIAFVGRAAEGVTAKRTIDAKGLVVAPGFIDMLGQSENTLLVDKQAVSKLTQGITTEITGEGESAAPVNDVLIAEQREWLERFKLTIDWRTLAEYFDRLEKQGMGINLGTYVGATQVRKMVLGNANREPTSDELETMKDMVDECMRMGAMGLSSSLIYAPAAYAKTEELIELAKVASRHGGIYATHIRNEGSGNLEALREAFSIGLQAGIPVEIWHLKAAGRQNWGRMKETVAAIEKARADGLDVTADQYPYVASGTSLSAVIPPSFHEGGSEALVERLKDPAQRAAIRQALEQNGPVENMWRGAGGPQGILISSVLDPALKSNEGKTVEQIAKEQNKDPLDALFDLVIAARNHVSAVYFTMNEDDLRWAMQQPWVSVDTDAGALNPVGVLGQWKPHPRAYGTFARILGKYVRQEKVLRLEEAIRKMTSLAAQRMKLADRGMVRTGYFADLTLFDPDKIADRATFQDPHQTSVGVEYVFVNGVLSLEHGKVTGQLGGRPLRGPGYTARLESPEGLAPRGKVQGFVSDERGWPLPRTMVLLSDAQGKLVGTYQTRVDGRFEIGMETRCAPCTLKAERAGFATQQRAVEYNGANTLWHGFAMKRVSGF